MKAFPSRKTLGQRFQLWAESNLLGRLAPLDHPSPVLKFLFKIPVLFYRMGFGNWVGPHYLLLTTTGRFSGKARHTALEFSFHPPTGERVLMSGWGERSDWVKNLRANPACTFQIGRQRVPSIAIPLTSDEAGDTIAEYLRFAPQMASVFERLSQRKLDGTREALLAVAMYFPCFRLQPIHSPAKEVL